MKASEAREITHKEIDIGWIYNLIKDQASLGGSAVIISIPRYSSDRVESVLKSLGYEVELTNMYGIAHAKVPLPTNPEDISNLRIIWEKV